MTDSSDSDSLERCVRAGSEAAFQPGGKGRLRKPALLHEKILLLAERLEAALYIRQDARRDHGAGVEFALLKPFLV